MALSQYDLGVLASCVVLAAVQLVMLWRRLLGELRPLRARLPRLAAQCARGWRKEEVELDPFEQCVMKRIHVHDSQNAVNMTAFLSVVFCGILVPIMANICTGRRRWLTPVNDIMVLLANVVTAVVVSCPRHSQGRWLPLWHGSLVGLLHGFLQAFSDYEQFAYMARYIFPLRIILGWAMPRVGWAILYNGAHALLVGYRLMRFPATAAPANGLLSKLNQAEQELYEAVLIVGFTASVARTIAVRARHEVQETTLRGETSAMLKLLNLVCDVVLELDADLRIMEHVPKFVATLALAPGKSTKGVHLAELMPYEEDRESFQRHLRTHEDGSPAAGALHVRLRDSTVGDVGMEAFFVQFAGLDGELHYFVGLREFQDLPPAELKAFGRTTPPPRGLPARPPRAAEQDGYATSASGSLLNLPGGHAAAPCGSGGVAATQGDEAAARRPATVDGPEQPVGSAVSVTLSEPLHIGEAMQCLGGGAPAEVRAAAACSHGALEGRSCTRPSSRMSSPASSTDCSSDGAAGVRFAPTSQMGKDASIIKAMFTWVVPGDPGCCAFHGTVADVRRAVERLEKYACQAASTTVGKSQCGRCGVILASRSSACDVCGLRKQEPAVRVIPL